MTYTPEQLREWAEHKTCRPSESVYSCPCLLAGTVALSDQLRAHAAALEEIERVKANVAELEADLKSSGVIFWRERAERAESALADAERKIERLKYHAEAMLVSADKITPRTDANGVLATIHRDGYWTNTMPAGQDPFPYLSQHGPIEVCLASELAALRAQLAERDAELAALKGRLHEIAEEWAGP